MVKETSIIGVQADGEITTSCKNWRMDRLLRIKSVVERTGLSTATIYRREQAGLFPKRLRLGIRCVAWYAGDVDDFISDPENYRCPRSNR